MLNIARKQTAPPEEADPVVPEPEHEADKPDDRPAQPPSVLFGTPENPIPDGTVSGFFDGQDLVRLRFARWEPLTRPVRGTVCLFTGRAEFIEKYFETVTDLRRRGFHVAIMDWRGQGGSARMLGNPLKGHVTTFDQFIADVDLFLRAIVLPDCPGPYFALAHSMGGNVILQSMARRGQWFDRAVLVAPLLDLAERRMALTSLRRISEVACYIGLAAAYLPGARAHARMAQHFITNSVTSDERRFERNSGVLKVAPQLELGAPTIGWFHAAARAMEVVVDPDFTARIRAPLLMIAAGNDSVVSTPMIGAVGWSLRGGGCVTVDGSRHELLQERTYLREQFWAAFDAFIPGSGD